MAYSYPIDPCEDCEKKICNYHNCNEWLKRYRTRQGWINGYARKPQVVKAVEDMNKFRYDHPDAVRRYLRDGVCGGCPMEETCDTPCRAYLRWWNDRMKWLRGRLSG